MRPWYTTGIGYTRRDSEKGSGAESQYVVVDELKPKKGMKGQIVEHLRRIVALSDGPSSEQRPAFSSLVVLDRGNQTDPETGDADESIYIFLRSESKAHVDTYIANQRDSGVTDYEDTWKEIDQLCDWGRKTTWVACDIGFVGPKSDRGNTI